MAVGANGNNPGLVIQKQHIRAKADFAGALLVSATDMDGQNLNAALERLYTSGSTEASSRLSGDASVTTAFTAADTALSSGLSTVDSANLSSAYSADVVLSAGLSTVDSQEASSRLSADTSLAARLDTLEGGVDWDAATRTLEIGDNVQFVFQDYSGFDATNDGDPLQMEIKYKS